MNLISFTSHRLSMIIVVSCSLLVVVGCGKVRYKAPSQASEQPTESSSKHMNPAPNNDGTAELDLDEISTKSKLSSHRTYVKLEEPNQFTFDEVAAFDCEYTSLVIRHNIWSHYSAQKGIDDPETFTDNGLSILLDILDPEKVVFTLDDERYLTDKYTSDLFLKSMGGGGCKDLLDLKAELVAIMITQSLRIEPHIIKNHNFEKIEYFQKTGEGPQNLRPTIHQLDERQRKFAKYLFLSNQSSLERFSYPLDSVEAKMAILLGFKMKADQYANLSDNQFYYWYGSAHLQALDIFSTLLNHFDIKSFMLHLGESSAGLGIQLVTDKKGYIKIQSIPEGGAAGQDGRLKVGDLIVGIKNKEGTWFDTSVISLRSALSLIEGKEGELISLKIHRPLEGDPIKKKSYEITLALKPFSRSLFVNTNGAYHQYTVEDEGLITPVNVGYIIQNSFSTIHGKEGTRYAIAETLTKLIEQGTDAVVLDYRYNTGGGMNAAVDMINIFADPEVGVYQKDFITTDPNGGTITPYYRVEALVGQNYPHNPSQAKHIPLVILISGNTASGAEVLSASLTAHGRAIVVGHDRTYGKGTVQSLKALFVPFVKPDQRPDPNNTTIVGMAKITKGKYYPPNGKSVQIWGLPSDINIKTFSHYERIYPGDHPFYKYHLPADTLTVDTQKLLGLGFRDQTLLQKLTDIYNKRTSSDAYLEKNSEWIKESPPIRGQVPLYLKSDEDETLSNQLHQKAAIARKNFVAIENQQNAQVADQLRQDDYMLDEALFLAAYYYQLCRFYDDGSSAKFDYDLTSGCLGSANVTAELSAKAEKAEDEAQKAKEEAQALMEETQLIIDDAIHQAAEDENAQLESDSQTLAPDTNSPSEESQEESLSPSPNEQEQTEDESESSTPQEEADETETTEPSDDQ